MRGRLRAHVSAGRMLPGIVPRLAVVALGCTAFALVPPLPAVIAAALAVVGALIPASLAAWGAALVIGLGQLAHPAVVGDTRSYLALAVVHLLHVAGGLSLVVDPRGMMQLAVLRRPLRRWLVVQVPAQALLAVLLALPRAPFGAGGALAVLAAVCLGTAAVVLVLLASPRPTARDRAPGADVGPPS